MALSQPEPLLQPRMQQHHVLRWLLHHPLQREHDLAVVGQIDRSTVSRLLVQLVREGLVERLKAPATRRAWLYYLTQEGLRAVASANQSDPVRLARRWGADESGLLHLFPRLESLYVLQKVVNSLVTHASKAFAVQGQGAYVEWHWQRDWRHTFLIRDRPISCHADASLLFFPRPRQLNDQETTYPLLLLVDAGLTGATDHRIIADRLEQLLRYRESKEQSSPDPAFPLVLILVPTLHQCEYWHRAAETVAAKTGLASLKAAIIALAPDQDIDSAWALPCRDLATRALCRLQDRLVPMKRASLPPGFLPSRLEPVTSKPAKRRRLIKGSFMSRAEALAPVGKDTETDITLSLRSLLLPPRQQRLVQLLYAHPLLTTEEVADFAGLTPDTAARFLYYLGQQGLISRQATNYGKRWQMTSQGLRLMAARLGVPLRQVAETEVDGTLTQRGLRWGLFTLRHRAGLYGFLAQLHREALEAQQQVCWWETGIWCARRYYDHQTWHNLRPGALLEYDTGSTRLVTWIEWNESTMPSWMLEAKLHDYACYIRSREWMREEHVLPLLLMICATTGQERQAHVRSCTVIKEGLRVWTTTQARLRTHGPLAAIWAPGGEANRQKPPLEAPRRAWHELLRSPLPQS